jgi:riboflavin kinase/FMN adenylyltransferase
MKVFTRIEEAASFSGPRAVAVGNFDGVHLGHRKILRCLVQHARRRGLSSLLLTFSPHPEKILGKGRILMIQTLAQRLQEIKKSGVETVLVMPFGLRFSTLPPHRFLDRVLVKALKARTVLVGKNFHFGRKRAGSVTTLKEYSSKVKAFDVCLIPPVEKAGGPVSSSRIRVLLREGRVELAGVLLGRPYEIAGTIVRGRSLGRRLGFPTANLKPQNEILPPGIFISLAGIGRIWHPSLTYIGRRPTFGPGRLYVETYLLHFQGSLYSRKISVRLLRRLRPDRKFQSAAALARQISRDVRQAKAYFRSCPEARFS